VPIYRDVVIGGRNGDGIWDASRFPLSARPVRIATVPVTPRSTLPLDNLEVRFEKWFNGLFTKETRR
jgi:hypothetical protein